MFINKFFILIILILSSVCSIVRADTFLKGDINGDGVINVTDYVLTKKYILKLHDFTLEEKNRADCNNDDNISVADYIIIKKIILEASSSNNIQYKVTFDSSGGSVVNSQTVNQNDKVIIPSNPTRTGYTFIEWQLNDKTYDFNNSVNSDIKLVAVWGKLNKSVYNVITSDSKKIEYVIEPSSSNVSITYKSSKPKMIVINDGIATANGSGDATVEVKANNKKIGLANFIVDYSFFDTCNESKSNTKVSLKTSNNRNINIYSCIENQAWTHQGIAVTNNSIMYTGSNFNAPSSKYSTWCPKGETYNVKQYNLSGNCDSQDYGSIIYTSGNFIRIYDKKTGKFINNYVDVAGHGQAFDSTSDNEIYINYFPKAYFSNTYGYGSHATGIAYINKTSNNNEFLFPDSTFLMHSTGNFELYKSPYKSGTIEYFKDVILKGEDSSTMKSLEFAIDEDHNQIAILDKGSTKNGNKSLYIYKLSDFKKGTKTLIGTYYMTYNMCGNDTATCGGQGIDLYGDYLYAVHEVNIGKKHYEGVSKINYKTCSKVDQKNSKCSFEELNIPDNLIGKEYGNGVVGLSEIEGISVHKGKVYASVITKAFIDKYRRNTLILLEKF